MAKDFLDELMEEGKRRNPQFPKMVERAIAKRKRQQALLGCRKALIDAFLDTLATTGAQDERRLCAIFAICEGKSLVSFLTGELLRAVLRLPTISKSKKERLRKALTQFFENRDSGALDACVDALDACGPGGGDLSQCTYPVFELQRGWRNPNHHLPRALEASCWIVGAFTEVADWREDPKRWVRERRSSEREDPETLLARSEIYNRRRASSTIRKARLNTWKALLGRLEDLVSME